MLPGVAATFPGVLIVTVRRLVLAEVAGPVQRAKVQRAVPASAVRAVAYRPGLLKRVRVDVDGGRAIRMLPNRRVDAARFAHELGHLLRSGSLPS